MVFIGPVSPRRLHPPTFSYKIKSPIYLQSYKALKHYFQLSSGFFYLYILQKPEYAIFPDPDFSQQHCDSHQTATTLNPQQVLRLEFLEDT